MSNKKPKKKFNPELQEKLKRRRRVIRAVDGPSKVPATKVIPDPSKYDRVNDRKKNKRVPIEDI